MKKEKTIEKVGMSDRACVVIKDRNQKVVKKITSGKANVKFDR